MAGTFYPPEVIKALQDFEYEGMGLSKCLYRGADHQVFKDIFVVRGKGPSTSQNQFDLLDVVQQVPRSHVDYPHDTMTGELGPYEPAYARRHDRFIAPAPALPATDAPPHGSPR